MTPRIKKDPEFRRGVHRLLDSLIPYATEEHRCFYTNFICGFPAESPDEFITTRGLYNQLLQPLGIQLPEKKINFHGGDSVILALGKNTGIRLTIEKDPKKNSCTLFIDREAFEEIAKAWEYNPSSKLKSLDSCVPDEKTSQQLSPSPQAKFLEPFFRQSPLGRRHRSTKGASPTDESEWKR